MLTFSTDGTKKTLAVRITHEGMLFSEGFIERPKFSEGLIERQHSDPEGDITTPARDAEDDGTPIHPATDLATFNSSLRRSHRQRNRLTFQKLNSLSCAVYLLPLSTLPFCPWSITIFNNPDPVFVLPLYLYFAFPL